MRSWNDWLAKRRAESEMFVEEVGLDRTLPEWALRVVDKCLRFCNRKSEMMDGLRFFWFGGYRVSSAGREVDGWKQVMLHEALEGVVVLVVDRHSKRALIRAKPEPGNAAEGHVLLAPTIQASRSNLLQTHGGTRPPRADLLDGQKLRWYPFCQDGGRFYRKINNYAIMLSDPGQLGELMPDERWFTPSELREAVVQKECNEHLLQAITLAQALISIL